MNYSNISINNNNFKKYQNVKILKGHTERVVSLIQLNSGHIATGSYDNTIKIWDLKKEQFISSFFEEGKVFCLLEFEPNKLLAGTSENNI